MKKSLLILKALVLNVIILINNITTVEASSSTQKFFTLSPVLKKIMPAVVSIIAEGSINLNNSDIPQINDQQKNPYNTSLIRFSQKKSPIIQKDKHQYDDIKNYHQKIFKILGSGVIINSEKGYIVTNNHVVNDASKIEVKLSDNRHYYAKLIGQDIKSDIALLQLQNVKKLTVMKIADSDKLRIGDYTIAIGNPYGLGESATYGIVSGLKRNGINDNNYQNFIQTDAAINRGNSGGALVNLKGELIGINTAIFTPDGGNTGIGFAIPSNTVKEVIKQIIDYGQVKHIELGILGTDIDSKIAKAMNLKYNFGILINRVLHNSTAAEVGIEAGDVITFINNDPVDNLASMYNKIGLLPIGSIIKLSLSRSNKYINLSVKLEKIDFTFLDSSIISNKIEGASLTNGESYDSGVYVEHVVSGSAAANIGLQEGDIIIGLNNQEVKNLGDLRRILDNKPSFLAFYIHRANKNIYLF
ncbi:Do family serine endopeptidase [Candidatus Pantoea edessiphila]|uniref:Serine endoprotease n=1 Tax=Candidatus Pantoea edessiphila TaxID=2044610 RepID=A0A2P5SW99_9GAMM|nr:Do family serine endopeptidase [Candidatus Pantoea edessiphila]PPI86617.1 serine endoprotease [Candidatus Pantoea edessiphila]